MRHSISVADASGRLRKIVVFDLELAMSVRAGPTLVMVAMREKPRTSMLGAQANRVNRGARSDAHTPPLRAAALPRSLCAEMFE